jgi:hypothetical protein
MAVEAAGAAEPPLTEEDVDRRVPLPVARNPDSIRSSGEADLAQALLQGAGSTLHPIARVDSPLWRCYGLWGFEDLMMAVADTPGLVRRACSRFLAQGLSAIHYFCGDPSGKWDRILALGADALSLEESKKGFSIDIEEVVDRVDGRMCVLGNLDAITLLERGSDAELERVRRYLAAARSIVNLPARAVSWLDDRYERRRRCRDP